MFEYSGHTLCGTRVRGYNEDAPGIETIYSRKASVCKRCEKARPEAEALARGFGHKFIIEEPGRNGSE